jgi:hypothetical protein
MVIFLSSCQQNLDVEIKTNDKLLVVNGEFTNDSVVHSIELYCSGSLITGRPQAVVSGATIYLTDKTDTFNYIENRDTLGLYQTLGKCRGKGGHIYHLSITNIDIDKDGKLDSYTANSLMPLPIKFDSLTSKRGLDGDRNMGVINRAYYKTFYNGPDYVYPYVLLNKLHLYGTITDRLGSGEINRAEKGLIAPKVVSPGSFVNNFSYFSISKNTVVKGDTISFICFNFTKEIYGFLKEFDNNTYSGDSFQENIYDQLKIPSNVSTNIEPAGKSAGYFFVYSVSSISKVFYE